MKAEQKRVSTMEEAGRGEHGESVGNAVSIPDLGIGGLFTQLRLDCLCLMTEITGLPGTSSSQYAPCQVPKVRSSGVQLVRMANSVELTTDHACVATFADDLTLAGLRPGTVPEDAAALGQQISYRSAGSHITSTARW